MIRYKLVVGRRFRIYLHNIRRPDASPDFHDHPWPFVSIVLRGGYAEELMLGRYCTVDLDHRARFLRPAIVRRAASDTHRIAAVLPHTWTLVICGRKSQEWGFYDSKRRRWRSWRDRPEQEVEA